MGFIFVGLIVFLPLYLVSSSISEISTENEGISAVLRDIAHARPQLAQREAEREASMARYRTAAPPLGSFMEARASEQELNLREVNEQPAKIVGEFRRRNTRATLPNVGLRPVVKMLTSIVNSRYPVALERLEFEHFRAGDTYNVQVGIVTYSREDEEGDESDDDGDQSMSTRGRAGPPAPR
ncbi:MAG: hypothetical protein ACI9KE_002389 [Polyangiales bacterium]|jgi:hypothetical protein